MLRNSTGASEKVTVDVLVDGNQAVTRRGRGETKKRKRHKNLELAAMRTKAKGIFQNKRSKNNEKKSVEK